VENSSNLTSYQIKAKRSGVITFKDAAIGEVVEPGSKLFTISNLATVWVHFGVYQKDLAKIKKGQKIRIVEPYSKVQSIAKITYIAPIMDEASRTVTVRATISAKKGTWKPGMFVNGHLKVNSHAAKLRVPKTALHQFEGETVVFVQKEEGFEPKAVTLGVSNEYFVEVLEGLLLGDKYAVKNGFIIKAELGKSEMSGGHSH
jgi:cobalt-zinc-cadmium efflux system membrane fusion protein